MANKTHRPLYEIAAEIRQDWKPVHVFARQYVGAMQTLNSIDDMFMNDPAREVVGRFLSNASTWKGETARRIKKELNAMLK